MIRKIPYHTYILLLKPRITDAGRDDEHCRWHDFFLPSPLAGSNDPWLVYNYAVVFNGFSTRLKKAKLEMLFKKTSFIHAFSDQLWHPPPCTSWSFSAQRKALAYF
jgi:hypothetical protein